MQFVKMHGIGNDYVFINGFEEKVDDPAAVARAVSDRHFGIGSDGLILALPADDGVEADLKMRMFNADGSEAEMCGNGVRCVCKLAHDHGVATVNPMRIQTGAGVLQLNYLVGGSGKVDSVTVDMGEPILKPGAIPVDLPNATTGDRIVDYVVPAEMIQGDLIPASWFEDHEVSPRMTCVSMGNPHAIFYCRNVELITLARIGPVLEHLPIFPNRVNVHFVQMKKPNELIMRTWERGSGITLACGTGASAVCVAGVLTKHNERTVLAHLPGGDLELEWRESNNHVYMTGAATEVFTGTWNV